MLYTLLLSPFAKQISNFMAGYGTIITRRTFAGKIGILFLLLLPAIPHLLFRGVLDQHFPTTHDVVSDWANHAHSFTYLLTGYLFAKDKAFWNAIERGLSLFLFTAVSLGIVLTFTWLNWGVVSERTIPRLAARIGRVIYVWVVIAALLGLAQKWLNKPSKKLRCMT